MKTERVGLSVLDEKMHEFMYLSMFKVNLEAKESNNLRKLKFSLDDFQVDNQLYRRFVLNIFILKYFRDFMYYLFSQIFY